MSFQVYYIIAIILVLAGIALAMCFSIKKYDERMAAQKKKKKRFR